MVRTIIYSIILVSLCGTLLWWLWTTGGLFKAVCGVVIVAAVICTVVVIKDKMSGWFAENEHWCSFFACIVLILIYICLIFWICILSSFTWMMRFSSASPTSNENAHHPVRWSGLQIHLCFFKTAKKRSVKLIASLRFYWSY